MGRGRGCTQPCASEFGSLNVLVNNAGGVEEPYFPEGEPEHWRRAIGLNLRGVMLGIHFGVRAMRKRGGGAVIPSGMALVNGRSATPSQSQ